MNKVVWIINNSLWIKMAFLSLCHMKTAGWISRALECVCGMIWPSIRATGETQTPLRIRGPPETYTVLHVFHRSCGNRAAKGAPGQGCKIRSPNPKSSGGHWIRDTCSACSRPIRPWLPPRPDQTSQRAPSSLSAQTPFHWGIYFTQLGTVNSFSAPLKWKYFQKASFPF